MSTGPDVTDIFISYASADRPRVKPLVDALQQQGWSVWWDRTILAGKTFDRVIEAALKDSRCVIVLWSRDSVDSDWVWTEADDGKRRGILVPAMLDDVNIPLAFRRIQTANLIGWSGALRSDQFNELSRAVSDVLSNSDTWPPDAKPAQESKRSTQQTQQQRDHNQEEANKTTLKQTESEQLEQEKQAQAGQELLEREKTERAEQERVEGEKQTQAVRERREREKETRDRAEQERLEHEQKEQAAKLGQQLYQKLMFDEASGEDKIRRLRAIVELAPNHAPAMRQLATELHAINRDYEAAEYLKCAIHMGLNDEAALREYAEIQASIKRGEIEREFLSGDGGKRGKGEPQAQAEREPPERKRAEAQPKQEEMGWVETDRTAEARLEQEKEAQARAEQERLERENAARAEQERVEREKQVQSRAEQQRIECEEEARYEHEAKQVAKLQERSHFRDSLLNRYFTATVTGVIILALLVSQMLRRGTVSETLDLKYEPRQAKEATTKLPSTEALTSSSAPNNTVTTQNSQASPELTPKSTSMPSKRHVRSTPTTNMAGADERAVVKEAAKQPTTQADERTVVKEGVSQPTTQQERQERNGEPHSNSMNSDTVPKTQGTLLGLWTDQQTHLTWTPEANQILGSWASANDYCTLLNWAGFRWRLPTVEELKGLYDRSHTYRGIWGHYHIKTNDIKLLTQADWSATKDVLFDFTKGRVTHSKNYSFPGALCVTTDVPPASR